MKFFSALFWLHALFAFATPCGAGEARAPALLEWEKTVEAARKEGKLVAAIPASAELRKAVGEIFPKRFPGIELELTNARGPSNASKIAAEHAAGVRYFDLLISGTATPFNLLYANILDPVEPLLILPEVKDPRRWFGGHVWLDNAKRFIYAFQLYQSEISGITRAWCAPRTPAATPICSARNGAARSAFSIRARRAPAPRPGPFF